MTELETDPPASHGVEREADEAAVVFGERIETARRYVDILRDRGVAWGLLGPREGDRLWSRHLLNSVAIEGLLQRDAHVVDVGSGAGLPGIPLALVRTDLGITLLEPLQRRAEFLEQVVVELDLGDRVRVVRSRAEDHEDQYDVVTARAVGALRKMLPWCAPLLDRAGEMVLLKGSSVPDELVTARPQLKSLGLVAEVLSVRAHPASESTTAVRLRRR